MSARKNPLNIYLQRYAETEIALLDSFPFDARFNNVVVIPAYKESTDFLSRLLSQHFSSCLFILVINQPDTEILTPTENLSLLRHIQSHHQLQWQFQHLSLYTTRTPISSYAPQNKPNLLVVDRFSLLPIPHKQGVGLARKIGCDIAIALVQRGNVTTPFIHSTDADTQLPADYFAQTAMIKNASAAIYQFKHECGDDAVGQATQLYEASINYYVAGLTWANSQYAFPTIGSCIAISPQHYCEARGFPKRAGGEDFYLLNKLAKLAPVKRTNGEPLRIQARTSDRVPFGTGPAVEKLLSLSDTAEFTDYDPRVFVELKGLLKALTNLPSALMNNTGSQWWSQLSLNNQTALQHLDFAALQKHLAEQTKSIQQGLNHIHIWFDGFRTLKYIHYLTDNVYPEIPHHRALSLFDEIRQESVQAHT